MNFFLELMSNCIYILLEESGHELLTKGKYTSQKSKLKRLLHLLKMLAYVQKVKSQRHHGLVEAATSKPFNSVDNELLKLGENPEMIENSIKGLYPDKHKSSNSDLDDLLEMVNRKRHKEHSNLEENGKLSAVCCSLCPFCLVLFLLPFIK